jgi:hypothetical protein
MFFMQPLPCVGCYPEKWQKTQRTITHDDDFDEPLAIITGQLDADVIERPHRQP